MEAHRSVPGELDIRRFDPSQMKPDRIAVCIGKRGTGKTVLMQDIMYHLRHKLHYGLAMTPTQESAQSFRGYMPASSVYQDYHVEVLERMLSAQRTRAQDKGTDALRNLFLVLDDCMYDKAVIKGKAIRDLFMNGRHYKITFLAAVQYLMDLSPALRTQVDYCFALRENVISNRERLYKYFFGAFATFEDFSRVLDACTSNYECLVIDNTVQSNDIADCIFWYKASADIPSFRLCAPIFWELEDGRTPTENHSESQDKNPRVVDTVQTKRTQRVQRIVKHALPGVPE